MTVYVVQEARGINLLPAEQYGDLRILLPPGNVAFSAGPTISRLKRGLARFSDNDYGRMKLLKWDRQEMRYYVVEYDLMRREDDF